MQKFYSLLLSFLFLFHSTAFSYNSSSQIEQENNVLNQFSWDGIHDSSKLNHEKYKKIKNKMIKGLKKEIRKNKKLSKQEQDKRWQKKLQKRFKTIRKNLPRFYKNKNLQRQMDKKQISYHDMVKKFSPEEETKVFISIQENVTYYGSYLAFLKSQLADIEKGKFDQVVHGKKGKENYRSVAQFDGDFWVFFGILLMIIVPVAVVLIIISISVILSTGGLGTPLVISWIVVLAGAAVCGIGMLSDLD